MTDLPSNQAYIQAEETDAESAISEQTMQKIGSAINFINDLFKQAEVFTSSTTWQVPEGVERVFVYLLGGGGGGAGGSAPQGGGGGSGCTPWQSLLTVTPLDTYTITVGSAGTAGATFTDGGDGGSSRFDGPEWDITIPGGEGGKTGTGTSNAGGTGPASTPLAGAQWVDYTDGGDGSGTPENGEDSLYGSGGSGGGGIGGRGGGGGAGVGNGGNGGDPLVAGTDATGYGSGGGGGGSSNAVGGSGSGGLVIIAY